MSSLRSTSPRFLRSPAFARFAIACSLALPLAACTALTNFGSFHAGGSSDAGIDARPSTDDTGIRDDAGSEADTGPRPDTGMPSECDPACDVGEECCSGVCVDLTSDVSNCGECGMVCVDRDNSTPACDELGCDYDCEDGFDDCDLEESNGCEQQLNTASDCGSCDHACSGETPVCNGTIGSCVSGCTGSEMNCDGTCVDVMGSDVTHCGSCTTVCAMLPNASRSCGRGTCAYACEGIFVDCNGDLGMPGSDGCETTNRTFYTDADRDGFGAGVGVSACAMPPGTSVMGGDCDDTDGLVYPGASETCNGADENCDGVDDDGITYMGAAVGAPCACPLGGSSSSGTVVCGMGGVATCGAYPTESCNGRDDDCDGSLDDGFTCVARSTASCTISSGTCTAIGTRMCDDACNPGTCMPPAETCNGVDDDCDGVIDEGALTLGPPRGGFADMMPARFVAAAWRDNTTGGAALVVTEGATIGRIVSIAFFDATGTFISPMRRVASSTVAEYASGLGVNVPATLAWDGTNWIVWYLSYAGAGGELRRASVSPSGTVTGIASPDLTGISSVAAVRGPTGDVGVVANTASLVYSGVWRGGSWARTLTTSMGARGMLDYAAITPLAGGDFLLAVSDLGTTPSVLTQRFNAVGTASVYSNLAGSPNEIDLRVAFEPMSGRVAITYRHPSDGAPFVVLYDAPSGSLLTSPQRLGTSSNGPRVAAGGGEIYVGVQPDIRRVRPDTGVAFMEGYDSGLYTDAVLATPGATQRALTFAYALSPIEGPAIRRLFCAP